MTTFTVLDQVEEDKLHATRLLGIEERPFKRITKRLLAPNTPIHQFLSRRQSNHESEATEDADEDTEIQRQKFLKDIQRFREEVILDFAAFESSIARIQFLRAANEQERRRYGEEKLKIEATAEEVRENIASLRVQLEESQRTLAVRKTYDVLADKITKNPALKPRDEQHVNIEKLRAEIEELDREGIEHTQAWIDRREQIAKVSEEGARLRRLIRDEKEPEKEDEDGDDDENMIVGERDHDPISSMGTPRPHDESSTPLPIINESGAMTPQMEIKDGEDTNDDADVDMTDHESGGKVNGRGGIQKSNDDMDTN